MTGLDLESFLYLLRADWAAWVSLGAIVLVLALMTWTTWGSRRVLRKCLALSIIVHVVLLLVGGRPPLPGVRSSSPAESEAADSHIRQIRVAPEVEGTGAGESAAPGGRPGRLLADWDRPGLTPTVGELVKRAARPDRPVRTRALRDATLLAGADPGSATPELNPPEPPRPDARPAATAVAGVEPGASMTRGTAADLAEIPEVAIKPNSDTISPPSVTAGGNRVADARPPRPRPTDEPDGSRPAEVDSAQAGSPESGPAGAEPAGSPGAGRGASPAPALAMPDAVARPRLRRGPTAIEARKRSSLAADAIALTRVTPAIAPSLAGVLTPRAISEVPEVYRPRLAPNRSARAQRSGATAASEEAVERGLDWLARHQDSDGRWNGGTEKYADQTPVTGDTSFTVHCPPGEICFGECYYAEADTAMTGLALLAYLGSGYTHAGGKYANTVGKGIQFLLAAQKPDGDLRGESRVVGMYCHAIASLALCEAYALTRDPKLLDPAERAIGFIVAARSTDGMAWRYHPGSRDSDTSILGWVILALKSAKESGLDVPSHARAGAIRWLASVAGGRDNGLARYQPEKPVTPTMTAEAWVCRQFLGTGGPGPASDEAARYLLNHGPDRDPYNLYYWYYGTLAMFQHGGATWSRWNSAARDQLVKRQSTAGHQAGSWDPDEDRNGARGGRIYSTAVATLTLEVYYRYLRLYAEPSAPPRLAPVPGELRTDPGLRRADRKTGTR